MIRNIVLLLCLSLLAGCEEFLSKSPSEGGLVGFSDASQFDALLNETRIAVNRYEWNHSIMASDDCFFDPLFGTTNPGQYQQREAFNVWNSDELKALQGNTNGFIGTFMYMYTVNYITENIDNPNISGSSLLKKQVKAEAMFWRANYHFNMLVQYCMHPGLNNGNYPGIGYRNTTSTDPETFKDRETVSFTLAGILHDLKEAEKLLTDVGKNSHDITQPWRVTAVTVQALRARIELYIGNYTLAHHYAKMALVAYSFLYDLNDETLFALVNRPVQSEVWNNQLYAVYPKSPKIASVGNTVNDPFGHSLYWYKEAYFRSVAQFSAMQKMPPSQALYNLYHDDDLRKSVYYNNNLNINISSLFPPRYKDQLVSMSYMKHAQTSTVSGYLLGVTVPEVMLILAECEARGFGDGQGVSALKELRKHRFPKGYQDPIQLSLKSVKEERRRELAFVMRWYDLKRYNALDNDNIVIEKKARRDPFQISSEVVTYVLAPNSLSYAQPIPEVEVKLLGWEQNDQGGVSIK